MGLILGIACWAVAGWLFRQAQIAGWVETYKKNNDHLEKG